MKNKFKFIVIPTISLIAIIIVIPFTIGRLLKIGPENQTAQVINPLYNNKEEEVKDNTTTIYFLGDIMLTRGVKSSVDKNFEGDYSKLFENLDEIKDADILFGNLEGDVSARGNNVGSKYSFRMEPKVLPVLKDAGFDIVSFANNHVGDWNTTAFEDTLYGLKDNGILKTGAGFNKKEAATPTIIEKNGTRFGFLGFSDVGPAWMEAQENKSGILLANDPNIEEIISNAKNECDVLIVSFHFGDEYKTVHNARQENLAKMAIDNGADMIIGHHPHVIEDISEYKGKPIVYSLGNFIFDQSFSVNTMRGMLFSATFKDKELIKTEERIITLDKKFQPEGIFTKEEVKEKDEISSNTCPKPNKEYADMTFLNIGQIVKLPDTTYIPENLRELNSDSSIGSNICLIKEARNAFEDMTTAAKKDGYIIKAISGFRSYEFQKTLFSESMERNKENAVVSVAKPGYSEHQLGTAIDLTGSSINYAKGLTQFGDTEESKWLEENAYLYGFVLSYPKDKVDVTGYKYEPWHYRYVGIENAKEIKETNLTITEFLERNKI